MWTAVWAVFAWCIVSTEPEVERVGTLADPALQEVSGIVRSRRYDGIFWVHNDSGHLPELFAVKRDGTLVQTFRVAVPNLDWEDVAIDDAGHLFIGDIGNNANLLPVRSIYQLDEPNPHEPAERPLPVTRSTFYTFPKKHRFDAEGLFIFDGHPVLVAKTFDEREAELYRLPLDPPAPLRRPAVPERIGCLPGFREPATGASLSANGKTLAVCSPSIARVYERGAKDAWSLIGEFSYKADGIEAICWDGDDLILAGEGRGVFRATEAVWRSKPGANSKRRPGHDSKEARASDSCAAHVAGWPFDPRPGSARVSWSRGALDAPVP
jgi:hypothetical protein